MYKTCPVGVKNNFVSGVDLNMAPPLGKSISDITLPVRGITSPLLHFCLVIHFTPTVTYALILLEDQVRWW